MTNEEENVEVILENQEMTVPEEDVPAPEPVEEETPELAEEETVEPAEEETVEPAEEETPAPAEEETPAPAEEETPAPAEEETPAPVEEETPASAEEETPAPAEEEISDPIPDPVPSQSTPDLPPEMGDIYPPENISFIVDNPSPITPSLIFIVPYRNREKQYEFFSNHMKVILEDMPPSSYKILYLHQKDDREFNRGAMKNIGFITVKNMYPNDYQNITLVFNDIDIMPYTKNFLNYFTTPGTVKHYYGFKFTLGGIVSINAADFEKINGFPNFWAWGYEDNLLQTRVLKAGMTIDRNQFYPILDPNMLHFSEGITRNINRTEYDLYQSNTLEGINSITNIQQTYNETTGFVDISYFYTPREENKAFTQNYDLRNGAAPFKNPISAPSRRKPAMGMRL